MSGILEALAAAAGTGAFDGWTVGGEAATGLCSGSSRLRIWRLKI